MLMGSCSVEVITRGFEPCDRSSSLRGTIFVFWNCFILKLFKVERVTEEMDEASLSNAAVYIYGWFCQIL